MKDLKSKLTKIADSAGEEINKLASDANTFFDGAKETIGNAFSKDEPDDFKSINKMHYFCMPDPKNIGQFLIITKREASKDVDPLSSPKERIFHAHNEDVISQIRQSMIDMDKQSSLEKHEKNAYSGDSLLNIANHIDKANENISSGVLLAGAATCLFNPILGVSIMTKTLVPSIGAKVASELLQGSGKKINEWSKDKVNEKVEKEVSNSLKEVEPTISPNLILYKINRSLEDRNYNPNLETEDSKEDINLIKFALKEVYGDYLGNGFFDKSNLSQNLKDYISNLIKD